MPTEAPSAALALNHLAQVADIVAAFVSNNSIPPADVPALIASVHASLAMIGTAPIIHELQGPLIPAVSIKKSLSADFLICLDDGKKFRSLKRHLSTLGMTPAEYRAKWGLPADYPMVAPAYSAQRSELAKNSGLGNLRAATKPTLESKVKGPAKPRGRPKKVAT